MRHVACNCSIITCSHCVDATYIATQSAAYMREATAMSRGLLGVGRGWLKNV